MSRYLSDESIEQWSVRVADTAMGLRDLLGDKEKMKQISEPYGKELILDLHGCDPRTFNRASIREYFVRLCDLIEMERCALHFWDDVGVFEDEKQTSPHTKGTSAVQFILTSNVTIHTLDLMKRVYLNVFSCKDFDDVQAQKFTASFFGGAVVRSTVVIRR